MGGSEAEGEGEGEGDISNHTNNMHTYVHANVSHTGWPSFRDEEVVKEHVRVLPDSGEAVSVDSTHLGHNIPDRNGNRYCINLVSVAGFPSKDAEKYDGGGRSRPKDLGWFPEI